MRDFYDLQAPIEGHEFPIEAEPSINWNHVDGPVLFFSDGQMHWLTWIERLQVWLLLEEADSLQKKLRPFLAIYLITARQAAT